MLRYDEIDNAFPFFAIVVLVTPHSFFLVIRDFLSKR